MAALREGENVKAANTSKVYDLNTGQSMLLVVALERNIGISHTTDL